MSEYFCLEIYDESGDQTALIVPLEHQQFTDEQIIQLTEILGSWNAEGFWIIDTVD